MKITTIVDEELEKFETAVLNGGICGATTAAAIVGCSRQYVYRLGDMGRIEVYRIGGGIHFNVVDCIMYRRKRRQVGNYAKENGYPNFDLS